MNCVLNGSWSRRITFLATIDDHVAFLDKSLDKLLAAFGPPPP